MDHNIHEQYKRKLKSVEELAARFQSGWVCASDMALVIPYGIYNALDERCRRGEVRDLTIHTMLDAEPLGCYEDDLSDVITGVSWFTGRIARKGIQGLNGDFMPNYYRDMPRLMKEFLEVDAYCAVVSPMDKHGYFSTFNGSNGEALLKKAKHIFLEVNENLPRIPSSTQIPLSRVTALCENHKQIAELKPKEPDEISTRIGDLIAAEIPDGATIQLGIGTIPDAVGRALKDRKDLGIHTEMFTDSMVDLIECGAVTNQLKPIHYGRSVTTFAYGTRRMYDFLDDNPSVLVCPVNYTNDPKVISQHPNFISVNAAMEVDFAGQVCAESIGSLHYSGTGGQADFVRGAVESQGGKSFIAFPSTAKQGTVSRICPILTPGSMVTTGKNDVDYIVTEYGIAHLRGKTMSQRTRSLINIAHPRFRDELLFSAKKQNIL